MRRALALWLCRKEFLQRWKAVKQVKYLRGKKNTVPVDRHKGQRERETERQRERERERERESLSHALEAVRITLLGCFSPVSFGQLF